MKEILVIPMKGESYTISSVGDAVKQLGVSYHALHEAIELGTPLFVDGKEMYVDIDIDVTEIEQPKVIKYELIAFSNNESFTFSSYAEVAKFLGRSYRTVREAINQKEKSILNRHGKIYELRVIENDKE